MEFKEGQQGVKEGQQGGKEGQQGGKETTQGKEGTTTTRFKISRIPISRFQDFKMILRFQDFKISRFAAISTFEHFNIPLTTQTFDLTANCKSRNVEMSKTIQC